jgi:PAS domain S-box-containing protein
MFELASAESRERFLSVLEHSRDIAYRRNMQLEVIDYVSPVVADITGYTPANLDAMTSKQLLALVHPRDSRRFRLNHEVANRNGKGTIQVRLLKKGGGIVWVEDVFTIQPDGAGQPLYRIGMARDIGRQKRVEKTLADKRLALAEKVMELERINDEVSQYAHVVSHDLKMPLRAIRNYTSFIIEDLPESFSAQQKKHIGGILKALDQGDDLVEDLLAYSRLGGLPLETEDLALDSLVREIRHEIDFDRAQARIVLQRGCPRLHSDRSLLTQILRNLISNGLKFNTSETKRIDIGWQPAEGGGELFVRDNGIGIAQQYHQRIFKIFDRLHSQGDYDGTGIGLAIVQKAVRRLGGSVRLESQPGEGSTFYLRLPPGSVLPQTGPESRRPRRRPASDETLKDSLQGRSK